LCKGFGRSLTEFFNIESESTFLTSGQKELLLEWSKITTDQKESLLKIIRDLQ
jgi:predicted Fe-S protein YdhL (DUF1289 family)